MSQIVINGDEGRQRILKGVNILADAVKVTLGAQGRNVIIGFQYGYPHATKDGVTVARSINLDDFVENMGASLIKEVASKTVDVAGDGTTTATILAQALITLGLEQLNKGVNPIKLKNGIDFAVQSVVAYIKSIARPIDVNNTESIKHIAAISANNDMFIGGLIAKAIEKIGKDGIFTIQESNTYETSIFTVEGMQLDRGYISHIFVNDTEKMECVLEKPAILLHDRKITHIKDIIPIMEECAKASRQLLIIAEDIEGEVLQTLGINKQRGSLKVCCVKAPAFGDRRFQILQDIAVLTGGQVISEDAGFKLENTTTDYCGTAEKIIINKDTTTIIDGKGKRQEIDLRIKEINTEASKTTNKHDLDLLKSRSARLQNGVAVLSIGGVTELEIKQKKDRIDDALKATKAAIEEGYVAGGGVTYLSAATQPCESIYQDADEQKGIEIVQKALHTIFEQILKNGGQNPEDFKYHIVSPQATYGLGYNIKINKMENMFDVGIIDPAKVIRVALENAASVAGMFLTTECIIAEKQYN